MNLTIVSLWAQKLFRPDEPQPFGGAELQLVFLSKELAKNYNVNIQFITRGSGPQEFFVKDQIKVYKMASRIKPFARSLLGAWDILRLLLSLKSSLFIQRGGGIETGITAFAANFKKKPFLFMTSHSWDVDRTHEKKRGWLYGKLYMFGLKRSAAVVTQTQDQSEMLFNNYGLNSLVLPSAHRIPETLPEKKKKVLWVGRCENWKNPHVYIEIAKALPHLSFTMVCPEANFPDLFEEISSQADRLDNITFLPGVPFEKTETLFAEHYLFINTSLKEGYPNTFVQAFKWGTPVLSLHVDPDSILTNYRLGMCAEGDESKLIHSIQSLLEDEQQWKEYSQNARNFAMENHDVKVIAKKLYSLIKSLNP